MLRIFDRLSPPMSLSPVLPDKSHTAPSHGPSVAPPTQEPFPALLAFEPVDSLGRVNETLRNQCNQAARKVASLAGLGEDLATVFDAVRTTLQKLETTTSELRQANGALAESQEQNSDLRMRLSLIRQENERNKNANQVLAAEADRSSEAIRSAEERYETAEAETYELQRQVNDVEARLIAEQSLSAAVKGELEQLQERLGRADGTLSSTQLLLAEEQHRSMIATEQNRTLNAAHSENKVQLAKIGAAFSDLQFVSENDRHRLGTLESEIQAYREESATWRGLYQSEQERAKASISTLQVDNETLRAQLTRSEQSIAEALGLIQNKTDALRRAERKLEEAAALSTSLEAKVEAGQVAIGESANKLLDCEIARAALVARVRPLIQAVRAKNSGLRRAQHEVRVLGEQVDANVQRHEQELDEHSGRLSALSIQLENERVRRQLAESALDVVREKEMRSATYGSNLD